MSPFEALVLHLAEAVNTWGDFGMDSDVFVGRKQSPTGQGNSQPIHCALFACRDHFIGRLATLCDDPIGLTCSIDVARRWGGAKEVAPFASFEAASAAVKEGVADAFLVPGAYPHLNGFIMDLYGCLPGCKKKSCRAAKKSAASLYPALIARLVWFPNLPPLAPMHIR